MKLAILSLCFLLVGFAYAAPAREQAVSNKRSAVNELAELQDFLSQLANMQQDEEEGAIQQDEEEPDQATIEELLSSLQQDEEEPDQASIEELLSSLQQEDEEPDQATIEELDSALQQGEPEEKAKMSLHYRNRNLKKYYMTKSLQLAKQALNYAKIGFRYAKSSYHFASKGYNYYIRRHG